jgi:hypothetical protein
LTAELRQHDSVEAVLELLREVSDAQPQAQL